MSASDAALGVSWRGTARTRTILVGCGVLLLTALVFSLAIGPVVIAPQRVLGILWNGLFGIRANSGVDFRDAIVVLDIRLPRTFLAAFVGAALAVSGAVLQGIFRNPLADPGLVGISPGAALAAVAWIVFGALLAPYLPRWMISFALPFASFAGSLIAIMLLHRLATHEGRTAVASCSLQVLRLQHSRMPVWVSSSLSQAISSCANSHSGRSAVLAAQPGHALRSSCLLQSFCLAGRFGSHADLMRWPSARPKPFILEST